MFIVATISKNSYAAEKIREIIEAGTTVLRFNFSHGTPEELREKIEVAKGVIKECGKEGIVKILADLPGNKIRLGKFTPSEFPVVKGDKVIFKSALESPDPASFIPVDYPHIGSLVEVGGEVSCGDGEIGFRVVKIIDEESFEAEVLNDRHIPHMKALNIGSKADEFDHITAKTIMHLKELHKINPDWVAFSFVNSGEMLRRGKKLLKEFNPNLNAKIVSKVETIKSLQNIREIIVESDIVLIGRGDMGLLVPIEELGLYQKKIVRVCKEHKMPVIVSTQILDSLLTYHIPARSDVLDLTNIVLDGADGIMLAKETGISSTPGHSVAVARKIIETVESKKDQFI